MLVINEKVLTSPRRQEGNGDSPEYISFQQRLNSRLDKAVANGNPLFKTSAENLWETYKKSFGTAEEQQYVNCVACRHFVERFGDLVTVDDKGDISSALWSQEEELLEERPAILAMAKVVRKAKITGPFISSEEVWGQPVTKMWRHMAVVPPPSLIFKPRLHTASQVMAEKKEDFKNVIRALSEFTLPMVEQALMLLETDTLYRSEKTLGPAKWLRDLHILRNNAAHSFARTNLTWRAVVFAPPGFCHPRASMVGTLLEDIAAGLKFDDIAARFKAKMHPLQYQRPTALPTAGSIAAAEKIIEKLGIASSLQRRFARLEEVHALWKPQGVKEPEKSPGVFGHLKTAATLESLKLPPVTVTWEKFQKTVLPEAEQIELYCPMRGSYCGFVTAVDFEAPPIIQWDLVERRNPVSHYFHYQGATADQFSLRGNTWRPLTAVTLSPCHWYEGFDHQGKGLMFIIEGAKETKVEIGNALFPEILKRELHECRSVIEAYAKSATLSGREEASACGLMVLLGQTWDVRLRVKAKGRELEYKLDRWD